MIEQLKKYIIKANLVVINRFIAYIGYILWKTNFNKIPDNPQKVCVVKFGNIGDLLCAIPSFNHIKKNLPYSSITLFSHGGTSLTADIILKGYKNFNNIILYDVNDTKTIKGVLRISRLLKNEKFDCIIYLPAERAKLKNILRDMIMIRFSNKIPVVGFKITSVRLFPKFQEKFIHFEKEAIRQLKCLPFRMPSKPDFSFDISYEDQNIVESFLKENSLYNNFIIFSMRGKAEVNNWKPIYFKEVAKYCYDKYNTKVLAIGGKSEFDYIEKTVDKEYTINCAGMFTIAQSIYLIKKSLMILSVDTGTAHMASLGKAKCIVLSSSYYFPNKWMPYGENIIIIRHSLSCSPCLKEVCPRGDNACINSIMPNEVCDKIDYLLGDRSSNI